MDRDASDYLALQELVSRCKEHPRDVGHWILRAYWLGKGQYSIDEVLGPLNTAEFSSLRLVDPDRRKPDFSYPYDDPHPPASTQ